MSIHEKINKRQAEIIHAYLYLILRQGHDVLNGNVKLNMPKFLRYGGYRNTCYDL